MIRVFTTTIILLVSFMIFGVSALRPRNNNIRKFAQNRSHDSQNLLEHVDEKIDQIRKELGQLSNEIRKTEEVPPPLMNIPIKNECVEDDQLFWYATDSGRFGLFAILGGIWRTTYGGIMNIYIIRAKVNNSLIPGKLVAGASSAHVGINGTEMSIPRYEVLSEHRSHTTVWVDYHGSLPKNVIPGGTGTNKETIYIGRASYSWVVGNKTLNNMEVGAFYPERNELVITGWKKMVIIKDNFQLLARTSSLNCK